MVFISDCRRPLIQSYLLLQKFPIKTLLIWSATDDTWHCQFIILGLEFSSVQWRRLFLSRETLLFFPDDGITAFETSCFKWHLRRWSLFVIIIGQVITTYHRQNPLDFSARGSWEIQRKSEIRSVWAEIKKCDKIRCHLKKSMLHEGLVTLCSSPPS
jgi:hypothetical protein